MYDVMPRHDVKTYAKTGGMTGVSNLVGYVESKNNGILAFAIMVNGFMGANADLQKFQEETLLMLINGKNR